MIISQMTEDDIPEAMIINRSATSHTLSYNEYKSAIKSGYLAYTIKYHNADEISGYIIAKYQGCDCYINDFGVAAEDRKKGIGKTLLNFLFSEAKKRRCPRVYLHVRAANSPAVKLYKSLGFKMSSIKPKFYKGKEDAFYLVKELS